MHFSFYYLILRKLKWILQVEFTRAKILFERLFKIQDEEQKFMTFSVLQI